MKIAQAQLLFLSNLSVNGGILTKERDRHILLINAPAEPTESLTAR